MGGFRPSPDTRTDGEIASIPAVHRTAIGPQGSIQEQPFTFRHINCSRWPYAGSPDIAQADVTLDAVAAGVALADGELIPGLSIKAKIGFELERHATGEFQPRRVFQQRHLNCIPGKRRCRLTAPVAPDIGARIGLPYLPVLAENGPLGARAEPPGGARGRAKRDSAYPVIGLVETDLLPQDLRLRLQNE